MSSLNSSIQSDHTFIVNVNSTLGAFQQQVTASSYVSYLALAPLDAHILTLLRCNTTPPVTNGYGNVCAGTVSGGTCTPTCYPGYYLTTPSSLQCVGGTWLGSAACNCKLCALAYCS